MFNEITTREMPHDSIPFPLYFHLPWYNSRFLDSGRKIFCNSFGRASTASLAILVHFRKVYRAANQFTAPTMGSHLH